MPFPLGKRTSSIQTQAETSRGNAFKLGRTVSLPADDDDVPGSARQHQAARARAANMEESELPLPATAGQKLKFASNKQRMRVSWGRVSRRLAAGESIYLPSVVDAHGKKVHSKCMSRSPRAHITQTDGIATFQLKTFDFVGIRLHT